MNYSHTQSLLSCPTMSNTEEEEEATPSNPNNHSQHSTNNDVEPRDDEDIEEDQENDEDDVVQEPNRGIPQSAASKLREQRFKVESLSRRLSSELVPIRVHDVVINGNTKTKDWVIEAELKGIENATSMQELMQASQIAVARLQGLEIFDSCKVRLEAGPRELPNTANVIVDVVETDNKVSGEFGIYTKPSVHFILLRLELSTFYFDSRHCIV